MFLTISISSTIRQRLAVLAVCLMWLNSGLNQTWSSQAIPIMLSPDYEFSVTADETLYLTLLTPIVMMLSAFPVTYMMDSLGRKRVLMLSAFPQIMTWGLTIYGKSIYVFYAARTINGITDAVSFNVVGSYMCEITTPQVRSGFVNYLGALLYCGQFLSNVIGSQFSIQNAACICMVVPAVFMLSVWFIPESPYFHAIKKDKAQAKRSLQWLLAKDNVDDELFSLQNDVQRQMSDRGRIQDLFTNPANRRATFAALLIRSGQHFCGWSAVSSFTQQMLEMAKITIISPTMATFTITGSAFVFSIITGYAITKLGRRKAFLTSTLGLAIICVALSVYFALLQYQEHLIENLQWLLGTLLLAYVVCFVFGVGMLPSTMIGELFSASIKTYGLLFNSIFNTAFIAIVNGVFYILATDYGLYTPFTFFAACTTVTYVLCYAVLPETHGRTLEEIQMELRKSVF